MFTTTNISYFLCQPKIAAIHYAWLKIKKNSHKIRPSFILIQKQKQQVLSQEESQWQKNCYQS